jgi:hypothetical protein
VLLSEDSDEYNAMITKLCKAAIKEQGGTERKGQNEDLF